MSVRLTDNNQASQPPLFKATMLKYVMGVSICINLCINPSINLAKNDIKLLFMSVHLFQNTKTIHNVADTDDDVADSYNNGQSWFQNRRKLDEQELNHLHPYLRSKYLAVCITACLEAVLCCALWQQG